MQINLTSAVDLIRAEMNPEFKTKYKSDWVDQNNPTDAEITKSIKDETLEGLGSDKRVLTFEVTT